MRTMRDKALQPSTPVLTPEQQQIEALKTRVTTLEGQVLNCLKFMRFQAEKEIQELDQTKAWPAASTKAEA
jgi:hypothetical protein